MTKFDFSGRTACAQVGEFELFELILVDFLDNFGQPLGDRIDRRAFFIGAPSASFKRLQSQLAGA